METIGIREDLSRKLLPSRPPAPASAAKETRPAPSRAAPAPQPDVKPEQSEFVKKVARGDEEAIRQVAEAINQYMEGMRYSLQFVPNMDTGTVVVNVLDSEGKLVRSIPPEEMAALSSKIGSSTGLLVNERLE